MKTSAIAVVGMAGRFPGARNIDEFWRNLRDSVESIRQLSSGRSARRRCSTRIGGPARLCEGRRRT